MCVRLPWSSSVFHVNIFLLGTTPRFQQHHPQDRYPPVTPSRRTAANPFALLLTLLASLTTYIFARENRIYMIEGDAAAINCSLRRCSEEVMAAGNMRHTVDADLGLGLGLGSSPSHLPRAIGRYRNRIGVSVKTPTTTTDAILYTRTLHVVPSTHVLRQITLKVITSLLKMTINCTWLSYSGLC